MRNTTIKRKQAALITPSANTLIGIETLALPELLIEIEVTAVVD